MDLNWVPDITDTAIPAYIALADAIERDLGRGRLQPGDKLPSQRKLAETLGLNFTTIARAYSEARRRGLLDARVGSGSRIAMAREDVDARGRRRDLSDRTMNQAPEPHDPTLSAKIEQSWIEIGGHIRSLMRYQSPGGSAEAKAAALQWLSRRGIETVAERLTISPGTHAAMSAIIRKITEPGDAICCEDITYPGIKSVADYLRVELIGIPCDHLGPDPQVFQRHAEAGRIRVLYTNPTICNPTTLTISAKRRVELVDVARRYGIEIIEDDAYGLFPSDGPPPIAMLAPELTYYVAGLSKCLGAGLRVAYVVSPSASQNQDMSARLRAGTVMNSPLTVSLVTHWIETGIADEILDAVRMESRYRQSVAAEILPGEICAAHPEGFHLWISVPEPWTRQRIADWMRAHALGTVASDSFVVGRKPPEAVRLCLGGAATRTEMKRALEFLLEAIASP